MVAARPTRADEPFEPRQVGGVALREDRIALAHPVPDLVLLLLQRLDAGAAVVVLRVGALGRRRGRRRGGRRRRCEATEVDTDEDEHGDPGKCVDQRNVLFEGLVPRAQVVRRHRGVAEGSHARGPRRVAYRGLPGGGAAEKQGHGFGRRVLAKALGDPQRMLPVRAFDRRRRRGERRDAEKHIHGAGAKEEGTETSRVLAHRPRDRPCIAVTVPLIRRLTNLPRLVIRRVAASGSLVAVTANCSSMSGMVAGAPARQRRRRIIRPTLGTGDRKRCSGRDFGRAVGSIRRAWAGQQLAPHPFYVPAGRRWLWVHRVGGRRCRRAGQACPSCR